MKKLILLLLLCSSCSYFNLTEQQQRNNFGRLMRDNLYDTDYLLSKDETASTTDVKLVRVKELPDLLSTMASLSAELSKRKAMHYSYFSSQFKFIVDERMIKGLAVEKSCDVVLYLELNDTNGYDLKRDMVNYKVRRLSGDHFFNAVFYCKYDVDKLSKNYK
jgi:hypothetical protein